MNYNEKAGEIVIPSLIEKAEEVYYVQSGLLKILWIDMCKSIDILSPTVLLESKE